ncbi:MAG: hypothetical protein HC857_13635 [Synechococcales cyanobacterium RU_4_20]|nr:hypothetical protein [Synechococcales cyanobacterium RU_4_20]
MSRDRPAVRNGLRSGCVKPIRLPNTASGGKALQPAPSSRHHHHGQASDQTRTLSLPQSTTAPFRQPKLWASIGIFGLSAFVLVRMFIQPEQFLGKAGGDRNAAANTQANQTLSPEARSIAAELDDLEVLLNEQAPMARLPRENYP